MGVAALLLSIVISSIVLYSSGLGSYEYISGEDIPQNQLYLLESNLINSDASDDAILILMTPIPIEAAHGNATAYKASVLKTDPTYYKIPRDAINLGLVKGDIAIKQNGKLQKFEPAK